MKPNLDDPRPRVIADIGLGEHLSSLDIDEQAVIDRMKSEGITDEEVANATINFRSEASGDEDKVHKFIRVRKFGNYEFDDNELNVYMLPHIISTMYVVDPTEDELANPRRRKIVYNQVDKIASDEASKTLFHEIRHMSQGEKTSKQKKQYYRRYISKIALQTVGMHFGAVASYEVITNSMDYDNFFTAAAFYSLSAVLSLRKADRLFYNNLYNKLYKKCTMGN